MARPDPDDVELELFVRALQLRHGYDFSGYARASLKRRVQSVAMARSCKTIGDLTTKVIHDDSLLPSVIAGLSVPVLVTHTPRLPVTPLINSPSGSFTPGCPDPISFAARRTDFVSRLLIPLLLAELTLRRKPRSFQSLEKNRQNSLRPHFPSYTPPPFKNPGLGKHPPDFASAARPACRRDAARKICRSRRRLAH